MILALLAVAPAGAIDVVFDSASTSAEWARQSVGMRLKADVIDADESGADDAAPDRAVCTDLWTQAPNAVDGRPSQDFEVTSDSYDAFGADDFEVPTDKVWTIESILIYGHDLSSADPDNAHDLTCFIFANDEDDDPDGMPYGTGVWDETFPASGGGYTQVGTKDLSFTPVTQPALDGGVYWLSCWIRGDVANGQWFWEESSVTNLSLAHWINPGDGFDIDATDWTDIQTVFGSTSPGFAFELCGTEATTTTISTTTTTTIPGDDDSDDDADDDVDDDADDDSNDDDNGGDDDSDDDSDDASGGGDDDDDDGGCCG